MLAKDNTKSCYIHIPFCKEICSYCDFCKLYSNSKFIDKYLNALEKELNDIYRGEVLDTIYIGGGTPSVLNIKELRKLFNIINKLNKSKNCSITIENNFESITKKKLDLYKENNVNRLSFGIETTNTKLLKLLNRKLNKNKVEEIIKYAKDIGIDDINLDLIYALPGESIDDVRKDLNYILSLNPTHISTYSLMIEEHTFMYINNVKNIDEEIDLNMYKEIIKVLKNNKYKHYEISNFAKENYESKHNLTYWHNNTYYGFGLAAASYLNNERYINTRSINKYIEGNRIKEKEILSKEDSMDYEIMLNLRLSEGINKDNFYKKYNIHLEDYINYKDLVNKKYLIETNNKLYIPEKYFYISNNIILELLNH